MGKVIGVLRDRKIYDDDPKLTQLLCDAAFVPYSTSHYSGISQVRCDYCGRVGKSGNDCASCGASNA